MKWTSSQVLPKLHRSLFCSGRPVNLPVSKANGDIPEHNCAHKHTPFPPNQLGFLNWFRSELLEPWCYPVNQPAFPPVWHRSTAIKNQESIVKCTVDNKIVDNIDYLTNLSSVITGILFSPKTSMNHLLLRPARFFFPLMISHLTFPSNINRPSSLTHQEQFVLSIMNITL